MLKTFDEMCEDETICGYCHNTDYGENKSCVTPNGYVCCEGTWCKDSYEDYLEDVNGTVNLVKYQNNVRLINKEEIYEHITQI